MLSTHHKVLYSCPLDLLVFTRAVKRLADVVMGLRLMYLRCFDLTMNAVGLALTPPPLPVYVEVSRVSGQSCCVVKVSALLW